IPMLLWLRSFDPGSRYKHGACSSARIAASLRSTAPTRGLGTPMLLWLRSFDPGSRYKTRRLFISRDRSLASLDSSYEGAAYSYASVAAIF
ncbi:hypothetical protein, partial [Pseudomonas fluorescens]|uniref:hypothetical protein n=1 Tax=Pseudomonas fluorescens TaxID=294 RepID=UPI001CD50885